MDGAEGGDCVIALYEKASLAHLARCQGKHEIACTNHDILSRSLGPADKEQVEGDSEGWLGLGERARVPLRQVCWVSFPLPLIHGGALPPDPCLAAITHLLDLNDRAASSNGSLCARVSSFASVSFCNSMYKAKKDLLVLCL